MEQNKIGKIGTNELLEFVIEYYKGLKILSEPDEWKMVKKYKNHKGQTCRDFVFLGRHKWWGTRCSVVVDLENEKVELLENKNYNYFARQTPNWIVFEYVPLDSEYKDERLIGFSLKKEFTAEKFNAPALMEERFKFLDLKIKNKKVLNNVYLYDFDEEDFDIILAKLESDRFHVKLGLIKRVNDSLEDIKYKSLKIESEFFEYNMETVSHLTYQQGMDQILDLITRGFALKKYELGLIRQLIKKIPKEEKEIFQNIISGFQFNDRDYVFASFLIDKE